MLNQGCVLIVLEKRHVQIYMQCSHLKIMPKDRCWLHAKYFPLRYEDRPVPIYYLSIKGCHTRRYRMGPGARCLHYTHFLDEVCSRLKLPISIA